MIFLCAATSGRQTSKDKEYQRPDHDKLMKHYFLSNLRKAGVSCSHIYFQLLLPFLPFLLFLLRRGLDFYSAMLSN